MHVGIQTLTQYTNGLSGVCRDLGPSDFKMTLRQGQVVNKVCTRLDGRDCNDVFMLAYWPQHLLSW